MKNSIRKGVFETNSSSVHAICISTKNDYETELKKYEGDGIHFGSGEFGWGHYTYDDIDSRLDYLWTGIVSYDYYEPDDVERVKEKIKKTLAKYGIVATFDKYIIAEYNEKKYTEFDNSRGYIDHAEGLDDFLDALFPNKGEDVDEELLLNFIFSNSSYIETGNDNSEEDYPKENDRDGVIVFMKGN